MALTVHHAVNFWCGPSVSIEISLSLSCLRKVCETIYEIRTCVTAAEQGVYTVTHIHSCMSHNFVIFALFRKHRLKRTSVIFYVQKELILSLFQNSVESDTRMCLLVQIKKKKPHTHNWKLYIFKGDWKLFHRRAIKMTVKLEKMLIWQGLPFLRLTNSKNSTDIL